MTMNNEQLRTAFKSGVPSSLNDESGGYRFKEPDYETMLVLADAPRSLQNYVAMLRSTIDALLAEWDALLDQHRRDSKELRRLYAQRDAARKVSKEAGAVVAALRAEMDALRVALEVIKNWPVTSPLNMDAHNMAAVAQAALAQEKEEA